MKHFIAIVGIVFQSVYVFGLARMTLAYFEVQHVLMFASALPGSITKMICAVLIEFVPYLFSGIVGLILTCVALRGLNFGPKWFLFANYFFAASWLYSLMIGTLIGLQLTGIYHFDSPVASFPSCLWNCSG